MIENDIQEQLSETNGRSATPRGGSRRTMAILLAGMFVASTVFMFAITGVPVASSSVAAPHAGMSLPHADLTVASGAHVAPVVRTSTASGTVPLSTGGFSHADSIGLPAGLSPAIAVTPGHALSSPAHPTALAPVAEQASTSENWYVNNYSSDSQIIQVGSSNQSFAETGFSITGLFNGTGTFYTQHGFTYVSTTSNGGQTWTTTWPGLASGWTTNPSTNPSYGDVNDGDSALAADSSGDLFLVSSYAQPCWADGIGLYDIETGGNVAAACNSTANVSAPEGFSFDEMPAGGGWNAPTVIDAFSPLHYLPLAASGGCTAIVELPYGNFTYGTPQIFSDPTGTDLSVVFQTLNFTDGAWTCVGGQFNAAATVTLGTFAVSSTNGGASWSTPASISGNFTPFSTGAYDSLNGDDYEAFFDGNNATAWGDAQFTTAQMSIAFTKSTDNGATWSTPGDIDSSPIVNFDNVTASPFAAVGNLPWSNQAPSITVDNWSASPYSGNLYVAYGDNRSTIDPSTGNGDPGVKVVSSTDGGTMWGLPQNATPDCVATPALCDGQSEQFFAPQVAVSPNGDVWVTALGYNTITAATQQWVVVSTDAGVSWSEPFPVSDTADAIGGVVGFLYQDNPIFNIPEPASGASGYAWGNGGPFEEVSWASANAGAASYQVIVDGAAPAVNGGVSSTQGLLATWTDCRDATTCLSGQGNTSIFAAYVEGLSVNASGANGFGALFANLSITSIGQTTTVSPTPTSDGLIALDDGATVSAQTEGSMAYNATFLLGFQEFSGGVIDTLSNPGSGTVGGTSHQIEAIYTPEPAGWINGTVTPTSANPKVFINGNPVLNLEVQGDSYWFNETELAGSSYTVSATATDYNSTSAPCLVNDFVVCRTSLSLFPEAGYLNDTVTGFPGGVPQGLAVTLQSLSGVSYPFSVSPSSGLFHLEAPWGAYWLNASATGLTNYSTIVHLPPGTSGSLHNLVLYGSHIDGTLAPGTAIVKIDGVLLGQGGGNYTSSSYNWSGPSGTYKVTASNPGYSVFSRNVTVAAGQNYSGVNIILVNHGWYVGTVYPATAVVQVGKGFIAVTGGKFNESLPTGNYTVIVEAAGYNTINTYANITPGNETPAILLMTQTPPPKNCTNDPTMAGCQGTTPPGNTTPANNNALIEYAGIGIVIVIVAIIAAMMLMRRGRSGGGDQAQQWDEGQGGASSGGPGEMAVNDDSSGGSGSS